MSHGDGYLGAAALAVALLREPDVAAAWVKPSALAEMTVGGLAGHLAAQVFLVGQALGEPSAGRVPIPLLEHYAQVAWIGAPADSEVNAGIRAKAEGIGSEGAPSLADRAGAALAEQRAALPPRRRLRPGAHAAVPASGAAARPGGAAASAGPGRAGARGHQRDLSSVPQS
jgi:hypothetical protein